MADYATLAKDARAKHDAELSSAARNLGTKADPENFFDRVAAYLSEEMKNANKELSKSGAPLVARNYLPEFESEVFLTFGTDYLCRITLEVHAGRYRISAVLSGPPNGYEISRKDYPCNLDASALEMHQPVGQGQQTIGIHPDQIAVDIISGILRGGFD